MLNGPEWRRILGRMIRGVSVVMLVAAFVVVVAGMRAAEAIVNPLLLAAMPLSRASPASTESPELQLVIAQEEAGEKCLLPALPAEANEGCGEDSHAETLASSENKHPPKQNNGKEVQPFLSSQADETPLSAAGEARDNGIAASNNGFNLASLIDLLKPNASPVSEDDY